jgi:hypothetical protein
MKILTSELTSHDESTHRSHIDEANTYVTEKWGNPTNVHHWPLSESNETEFQTVLS